MTFGETLDAYIKQLGVSTAAVASKAGLDTSTVTRYRNGGRKPSPGGTQVKSLADAIVRIAGEKEIDIDEDAVFPALYEALTDGFSIDYDTYLANLHALLSAVSIKNAALAKALNYDPSHVSKILSGQRRPGDLSRFTSEFASFIARRCAGQQEAGTLVNLLGCQREAAGNPALLREAVIQWLGSNTAKVKDDSVGHFLEKMDSFNLDDFIRSIHFDDIKLLTVPFQLPITKVYTGIREMMESELDFIKTTVLSKSAEDCILYSDMPIEEMAGDPEFPKKWMFGRAMMLKKGLHLHIVHDVNRPFSEMMLGLEGHIPMYMTGQISPYYLPASQNGVFNHLMNVSGAAALEGHAMAGHQADGKYVLYKSKDDVRHYRKRAEQLLEKALPLMDIYRSDRKQAFFAHLRQLWQEGDRRVVHSSLPIYTIEEESLDQLLSHSDVSEKETKQIKNFRNEYQTAVERMLAHSKVTLVLPRLTEEQFAAAPLNLALSELFIETDVPYNYAAYVEHLEQTKAFAAQHANLTLEFEPSPAFRNISYTVIGNKQVIVSKNKYPTIHFVIHHKKMVQAFQRFIPPIREGEST